ncbi:hypothetical protein PPL_02416 [Heterostelium album PN500]|uniref:Translin n=1 Tax=Heterostelium pallidum (strain ATCC 26659 / Pp 5 / PN500) TaxID=670386 RepID=D3AZN4_HETP5|nr:hypothetical protein PPL_02416 [Heterostelium album PN500]EFA85413.1 hypothetical protein PPL_02416 [Heterostelium album PN500]|eukprot:XP_020437522.1 hypothetical protein PPL_02416 [Heterostelium album PN500]
MSETNNNNNSNSMMLEVNNIFNSFMNEMEEEFQLRQNIKNSTTVIDQTERKMNLIVQMAHTQNINNSKELYKQIVELATSLKPTFNELKALIKPFNYYKYRDHWKRHLTQIVFCLAFSYWLECKQLLKIEVIQNHLGFESTATKGSITVELEDYLLGLCDVTNEMSRYCVNCVIRQDFETPLLISTFVNDLYAGFRLLNLKNDILRKRFDSMKYDIKKLEEVVYDLSVRKLIPTQQQKQQ